jgi:hypothetical protein
MSRENAAAHHRFWTSVLDTAPIGLGLWRTYGHTSLHIVKCFGHVIYVIAPLSAEWLVIDGTLVDNHALGVDNKHLRCGLGAIQVPHVTRFVEQDRMFHLPLRLELEIQLLSMTLLARCAGIDGQPNHLTSSG